MESRNSKAARKRAKRQVQKLKVKKIRVDTEENEQASDGSVDEQDTAQADQIEIDSEGVNNRYDIEFQYKVRREKQERQDRLKREEQEREDRLKREELDRLDRQQAREHEIKLQTIKASSECSSSNNGDELSRKIERYSQKLNDGQDADAFFTAFEKYAQREMWERETWVRRIAQCLLGKAREAQNAIEDPNYSYDTLKTAILEVFQLTPETYRVKFRNGEKEPSETVKTFFTKTAKNFHCWVKYSGVSKDDAEGITNLMIRDQILKKVPPELRKHLLDKQILDVNELAKEAELYTSHRSGFWNKNSGNQNAQRNRNSGPQYKNGQRDIGYKKYQHQNTQGGYYKFNAKNPSDTRQRSFLPKKPEQKQNFRSNNTRPNARSNYQQNANSQQQSNFRASAPNFPNPNAMQFVSQNRGTGNHANTNVGQQRQGSAYNIQTIPFELHESVKYQNRSKVLEARAQKFTIDAKVNGHKVKVCRDSQCHLSIVNKKFVSDNMITAEYATVRGIGGTIQVPLANIYLESEHISGTFQVAVVEGLEHDMLLGLDIDSWDDYQTGKPVMVVTRAQKKHEIEQCSTQQLKLQKQVETKTKVSKTSQDKSDNMGSKMNKVTEPKTKVDKQTKQTSQPKEQKTLLESGVQDLIEAQKADPTLKVARESVVDVAKVKDNKNCYYVKDHILMMKWTPQVKLQKQVDDLIVIPSQYRQDIMETAHDISGHMGITRTMDRITAHFHWPGLKKDVQKYCRECQTCQYLSKDKTKQKQLLRPLPIIDVPFKRVGMDIKGPLPVTNQGNKYILIVCDYATRYPEAIPIPDQTAATISQKLIEIFGRVGLPSEVVHDHASNFLSHAMTDMCNKLKINQIPASPYHQQTNGMVERFIQTMQNMIKSLSEEQSETWDEYLPLFLFAYREVPCEFTGYSPMHLLYGRPVRGPLSLIKERWVGLGQTYSQEDIPTKLLKMQANITKWMAKARLNKQRNQDKMRYHYNKKAQDRVYKVGEQVLVFLPEGGGKLDSKWQGPYKIVKKIGEVDYQIEMPDKRKSNRILHANLLKKWYTQEQKEVIQNCYCVTGVIQEIGDESIVQNTIDFDLESQLLDDSLDTVYTQTQTWEDVEIAKSLSSQQKQEVSEVLKKNAKAFSDIPGKTSVIKHVVKTTNQTPIRQRAYRTPHALKQQVKNEIDNMLKLGVIEETDSAYASPIVVVAKKTGDVRVCTDYRLLNKITEFDPYPIPQIDQILDEVAQAKFITTLDLTKGFYQVPLDSEAKAKSAFITPFGHFAYNVMPFGMKNSSATFQRLVDKVLKDCQGYCKQYIDDVAIYSNTWEEHLVHLDIVLSKIQNAGLTIKPVKSKIAQSQVSYLGHTVGNGQIKPMLNKLESVQEFPTPVLKKNVRAFLGLSGYYRKFVPQYATISKPLVDLTKKAQPNAVCWTPECEEAFKSLKEALVSAPILATPDFGKPFLLQTDASKVGIGAVLSQIDDQCREHAIVYLSRKMLPNELNYSVPEKECLAVVYAINKLRYYLQGHQFTVVTDHQALKWLENTRASHNRLMRWSLILQQFTFQVQYRKGIVNTNADGLSRRE